MDGPIWSMQDIRDLWLRSGGSAMYADIASAVAMATSGGRPSYTAQQADGSVNRGLWGINSTKGQTSTTDPVANARGAVEQSNNGTDWRTWPAAYDPTGYLGPTSAVRALTPDNSPLGQYPSTGNQPATRVSAAQPGIGVDLNVGIDILSSIFRFLGFPAEFLRAYLRYGLMIVSGASMMLFGFILMFVSLRQVKNVGQFVLETGAAGLGFGAGAAVLSGDRRRIRSALTPPPGSAAKVKSPKPPKPPKLPSGRHATGVSVDETLAKARHRTPLSEGGSGLGSPVVGRPLTPRTRKVAKPRQSTLTPVDTGPFKRRAQRYSPLTGNSPGTRMG